MAHPLRSKVEEKIKSAPVVIFMKGTPQFPQCGFSNKACQVLKAAGAQSLASVDVLSDELDRFTREGSRLHSRSTTKSERRSSRILPVPTLG